jgi:opacity protein-like surface antigen
MKKYVLALAMFCALAISSQAQDISVGLKGGLNISDVSGVNGDNRLSGHLGVFVNGKLNSKWSIQPELLYSGQGQQFMYQNREWTLALNYLQIPVMFQYHPIEKLYLEFGPQLGFLLAANNKDDGDKIEVDGDFKKIDFGLGFGLGIHATRNLGFYARYNLGLTDIYKIYEQDHMNRVAQIGVSYKIK